MKRARSFPTTHLGLAAFVWAVLMLAPPRAAAQCINLGGNWTYSESGTVTLVGSASDGETINETDPVSGNGNVTVTQTGPCTFQYLPIPLNGSSWLDVNLSPSQLASLARTVTVNGNNVQVTGIFVVVIPQPGCTITSIGPNAYTATGQVTTNIVDTTTMTLNGTGNVTVTGNCVYNGQNVSFTLTITASSTVTMSTNGLLPTAALSVSKSGNGTVTSGDGYINCGAVCSSNYVTGSIVTLTATPAQGWKFSGWSGPCSGTGSCNVTMTQAVSVGATFTQLSYTLTASATGNGTVTSTDGFINCRGTCSHSYPPNTQVTLNATPDQGWKFSGWSGPCSGTGSCNVTMTQDLSVGAAFISVKLSAVRMLDSKTLQLEVLGHFSNNPQSTKSLSVSTTLNGVILQDMHQLPAGSTGDQSYFFGFDLQEQGVARFTDNAVFPVTATVSENGTEDSTSTNGIVLLPTIVVPGIMHGDGGDHTYPDLESYFGNSSNVIGNLGVGQAYQLRQFPSFGCGSSEPDYEAYPTLYTLTYETDEAPFWQGAAALGSCVTAVQSLTWADNVNLVAHSKGGPVARWYLQEKSSRPVDRFIMAEPVNLGAIEAAWIETFGDWIFPYRDLLPVWPWERPNPRCKYMAKPPNTELEALNADTEQLPANVAYTIVYSMLNKTPVTRTGTFPYTFTYLPGDGIVPWFSQQGKMYDPNEQIQNYTYIHPFANVQITNIRVDGPHAGYLKMQPLLQTFVKRLLSNLPQGSDTEPDTREQLEEPRGAIERAGAPVN